MNSSHFQSKAQDGSATHTGFFEVHQHLDDVSHLFDEMEPEPQLASEQPKAKVLFQFFDGWPMAQASASGVQTPALY